MRDEPQGAALTDDAVLGGRLRLKQPAKGHRFGHDAVLLAASCPARAGEQVVDLGAGVGAAGLALAARIDRCVVVLVEIDPALAVLAAENAERNGLAARVRAVVLDATAPARAFAASGLEPESIARVLMNPPFNDPVRQRTSPNRARRDAHTATTAALAAWVRTAARLLRPRGTLSLIWRAEGIAEVLAALAPAFGAVMLLPVYPKPDAPAIRILVRATKASGAPLELLPGLVLVDDSGRAAPGAEAVLRSGSGLPLAEI
jgi:tRNA1(Val) A37 N6-methylase TrmN6